VRPERSGARPHVSSAIIFDPNTIDSPVNGSEAQLAAFDDVSFLNTAGAAGDASGLFAAISAMSMGGCLGRIHVDRTMPLPPPIESFRPLAAF